MPNWKKLLPCLFALAAGVGALAAQPAPTAKEAFTAMDWAALRSAGAVAVSPQGSILYVVTCGADRGTTRRELWTIDADGSHTAKLELPEGFSPMSFTHDGQSVYGAWTVNPSDDGDRFALAILQILGRRLTYNELIGKTAARQCPDETAGQRKASNHFSLQARRSVLG